MLVLADSPLRRALWTGPWPSPRLVVALRLCNELKNYVWRVFAPATRPDRPGGQGRCGAGEPQGGRARRPLGEDGLCRGAAANSPRCRGLRAAGVRPSCGVCVRCRGQWTLLRGHSGTQAASTRDSTPAPPNPGLGEKCVLSCC